MKQLMVAIETAKARDIAAKEAKPEAEPQVWSIPIVESTFSSSRLYGHTAYAKVCSPKF